MTGKRERNGFADRAHRLEHRELNRKFELELGYAIAVPYQRRGMLRRYAGRFWTMHGRILDTGR